MIEIKANELIIKYCPADGSILELGNQIMNLAEVQDIPAKDYYSILGGYKHTSIDQNGKDGALPLDLSKPITEELGEFDLITDCGTMEHVSDLYNCLANVFRFCKVGGIAIHKNPKIGSFNDEYHGDGHHFTQNFWLNYAKLANLEIIELFEYPIYHNTIDGWEVVAVLKKTSESKMPTNKDFKPLMNFVS